jgi:ABC-2 type transport system permease protein
VVAGFEELLLPYPTSISASIGSNHKFTELVSTSPAISGSISVDDWQANQFDAALLEAKRGEPTKDKKYVLAAWIRSDDGKKDGAKTDGKKAADKSSDKAAGGGNGDGPAASAAGKPSPLNVIYVGDIDLLSGEFVRMRNEPNQVINFRFDNVPFVLNVIDAVAGDNRFLEIRKRKPRHSTLQIIEKRAAYARSQEDEEKKKFEDEYNAAVKKADEDAKKNYEELQKVVDELRRKQGIGEEVDPVEFQEKVRQLQTKQEIENRRAEVEKQRLQTLRDKNLARIQRIRDQEVQKIQNEYKVRATFIPVIPPLLVGLVVWARRRVREREGVSRSRMKTT